MNKEDKQKQTTLTDDIYNEVCKHVGEDNAVKSTELTTMFGIDQRTLRHYISKIRTNPEYSMIIVGCNRGYYVCSSNGEFKHAKKRMYGMAFSMLKAAYANERKAEKDGQGRIDINDLCTDFIKSFGSDNDAK